ncbi:glycosyltransferase family 4 protein [Cecembia lonarensis]|uniref:Sugar transferase, PEP-CTERM/EpsH1 system associated n=1 Tax=Cecembia lonarensis (strain CCUG 58316 / KCTC 22772 / LW9) TaxID=1225176 RepID=K1L2W6_CECL9|nr:glycosyltransferase [Cecembia lonarensis]EKB49151.1 sugar transferase, PEP-CTERM/EpsH1 system associated [Cecembia lonarensis LW9]
MKVLWFSNTPALGIEFLSKESKIKGTGGWMSALNEIMKNKVDLHIAFHYPYKKDLFEYRGTKYYPVYTGNILYNLIKSRFFIDVPDDKYLDFYLNVINEVKPDIIHIHGTENSFLCILGHIKIPAIVSIQGNVTVLNHKFFSGFNGKFLNRLNSTSLKEFILGPKSFKRSKNFLSKMTQIEQKRMKDVQYIIGRTDWDYRITRVLSPNSKYFKGEELLREAFYSNKWDNLYQNEGKLIIFTTNSDNYFKGIETVFHSITLLQKIGIDIEWRIAGIKDNSLIVSICRSFLGSSFPKSGYKLLGPLDEESLVQELLAAHMYVMPSHIENSPNNLCEAMILGMPCIATFAGGTSSLLKDGEEGILIQDGDPWAMAGSIIELKNDYDKALSIGNNARRRALIRHDKELVLEQYLSVYNSILNYS